MSIDLDQQLADLRRAPTWSAQDRADVLAEVLATDPSPHRGDLRLAAATRRPRRRTVALAATAALAAAACIVVPTVLPQGTPGSAGRASAVEALHQLAHVAAITPTSATDHLTPGQFLHLVDVEHQTALAGQPAVDSRFEYWIRADGVTWQRRDVRGSGGVPGEHVVWLLPRGRLDPDYPAPDYLRRLPTRPAALEPYLRSHTVGSTSSDERVFVAVAQIVARGMAPPRLRAAAIEVLAGLGHVRLGSHVRDSRGNRVQEFTFVDPNRRPGDVQSLMFDTRTAQITEQRDYLNGKIHFKSSVTVLDIANTVPANIRKAAIVQK